MSVYLCFYDGIVVEKGYNCSGYTVVQVITFFPTKNRVPAFKPAANHLCCVTRSEKLETASTTMDDRGE